MASRVSVCGKSWTKGEVRVYTRRDIPWTVQRYVVSVEGNTGMDCWEDRDLDGIQTPIL